MPVDRDNIREKDTFDGTVAAKKSPVATVEIRIEPESSDHLFRNVESGSTEVRMLKHYSNDDMYTGYMRQEFNSLPDDRDRVHPCSGGQLRISPESCKYPFSRGCCSEFVTYTSFANAGINHLLSEFFSVYSVR